MPAMPDWWPFRLRHTPEDAPTVAEARDKRDVLFDDLDAAIKEVDRVQDQLSEDYEQAEEKRLARKAAAAVARRAKK